MTNEKSQLTPKLIGFTLLVVTVTVFTGSVTDPVNVTKLFVLGGCAFAVLGSTLFKKSLIAFWNFKFAIIAILFFLLSSIAALFNSKAPFVQSFYGVYGRNNGFLLYLLLVFLFISTLCIKRVEDFKPLLNGLLASGLINLLYAIWVTAFGDFIPWNNIYGNLLGTLGNPNFIGSFFGIFSGFIASNMLVHEISLRRRISYFALLVITFFGILESNAVQGKVLFTVSMTIVFFFWLRSKSTTILPPITFILISCIAFIVGVLGMLQIGPLTKFLYKESVSLRGEYWAAGWNTGIQNPFFGVGFDSFGDWYRRTRRESALVSPGVDTVTNAAHNVFLDLFAFGGWPLLLSYLALILITFVSIIRVLIRTKEYQSIYVAMVCIWVCYQLQSLISINQIGLAIWGWVFSAALIAYERTTRKTENREKVVIKSAQIQQKIVSENVVFSSHLRAGIFSILGLLIAVPPLSADIRWRSAQLSQDVDKVTATLEPSYMNPLTTFKFVNVVGVLETNGFSEQAHKWALEAVKFNPNSFDAWRTLTLISKSSEKEKIQAYKNMKRLDPLNDSFIQVSK